MAFTLCFGIRHGLADRKFAFKRFNGNNQATSYPNLVNLRTTIYGVYVVKTRNFCRDSPAIWRLWRTRCGLKYIFTIDAHNLAVFSTKILNFPQKFSQTETDAYSILTIRVNLYTAAMIEPRPPLLKSKAFQPLSLSPHFLSGTRIYRATPC